MDGQPTGSAPGTPRSSSRRQFLKGAVVLAGAAGLAGAGVWRFAGGPEDAASEAATRAKPWLDALADDVVSGGPGKDGIPAIDEPRFVAPDKIDVLGDDDPVFGLTYGGAVRAYPQLVLVWHEIVNDRIDGEHLSVTYPNAYPKPQRTCRPPRPTRSLLAEFYLASPCSLSRRRAPRLWASLHTRRRLLKVPAHVGWVSTPTCWVGRPQCDCSPSPSDGRTTRGASSS